MSDLPGEDTNIQTLYYMVCQNADKCNTFSGECCVYDNGFADMA